MDESLVFQILGAIEWANSEDDFQPELAMFLMACLEDSGIEVVAQKHGFLWRRKDG